jgi:hypothetical protein
VVGSPVGDSTLYAISASRSTATACALPATTAWFACARRVELVTTHTILLMLNGRLTKFVGLSGVGWHARFHRRCAPKFRDGAGILIQKPHEFLLFNRGERACSTAAALP